MRFAHWILTAVVLLPPALLIAEDNSPDQMPFRVDGRLVDEAGQGVAGTEIECAVYRFAEKVQTVRSGDDGAFVFELPNRPQLAITLRASNSDRSRQAFAIHPVHRNDNFATGLKMVLRRAREMAVTVVDGDERPVSGATVIVDAERYRQIAAATTDATGKAVLRLPVDAPRTTIVARKPGVGLDYFLYHNPEAPKKTPYQLPRDQDETVKLVLNGIRPVTIKVIDERGQPMSEVTVSPSLVEKPKKGGSLAGNEFADPLATTDEEGKATFDTIPADHSKAITFVVEAKGYHHPERQRLEPGGDPAEIILTLAKLVTVRGRVTFDNGQPAAGAAVKVAGEGYQTRRFGGETLCDQQGEFEFEVYPNQFFVFAASLDRLATAVATRVVRDEPPADDLHMVLRKATRVHGLLTVGDERTAQAGQHVYLNRQTTGEYEKLAENERLPVRRLGVINPTLSSMATTDERGKFELFAGPGKYTVFANPAVGLPSVGRTKSLTVADEAEIELELHEERPRQRQEIFTGRVVSKDQPQQGVAEALVTVFSDQSGLRREAITSANGSFQISRLPLDALVYARTPDGSLAGILKVTADDRTAIISIAPTATARGLLVDARTGAPLANVQIEYGVYPASGAGFIRGGEAGGNVVTDVLGEFRAAGLVPGWKYRFAAEREQAPDAFPPVRGWVNLASITPDDPVEIDLGNLRMKRVRTGAELYQTTADGNEQIASALTAAKPGMKHVLVVFGTNRSELSYELHVCFAENEELARALQANFVVVRVDVDVIDKKQHNADVLEHYGNPTQHGTPALVVLDSDGKQRKTKDIDELQDGATVDPKKVLVFLNRWKPAAKE